MAWSLPVNFAVAGALRLLLICYGRIHDALFEVRFTDIDYAVFTDAARRVVDGGSPYERATYRYSPIIAWLMIPSISLEIPEFGKLLFTMFDLLSALLVHRIVLLDTAVDWMATLSACMVLYNPLSAVVSARGNAESLLSFIVLLVVYLLANEQSGQCRWILASVAHGFAIHLKIYPVIYLPSLFFHFGISSTTNIRTVVWSLMTNYRGFLYGFFCCAIFAAFTFIFYAVYGQTFLNEALLYHVSRRDVKHNFSPYFYPLYLTQDNPDWSWIGSAAFIPQLFLILLFSWRYRHDLPFCWFACTFAFVAFNKVCTSQYFVWYLTFLPLIWYKLRLPLPLVVKMLTTWATGQAIWLGFAYLLEFKGWNVFFYVWLASLGFLAANCWVLICCLDAYAYDRRRVEKAKDA